MNINSVVMPSFPNIESQHNSNSVDLQEQNSVPFGFLLKQVNGKDYPILWKIKNVPNHQPEIFSSWEVWHVDARVALSNQKLWNKTGTRNSAGFYKVQYPKDPTPTELGISGPDKLRRV